MFAFVACGNNTSTPKCGDKDVQEKIVEMILKEGIGDFGGIKEIESMIRNIDEKDKDKLIKRMGLQNIITEETDEAKKKVTCKANLKIDIDTLKDIKLFSFREHFKKIGILKQKKILIFIYYDFMCFSLKSIMTTIKKTYLNV